MESETPLFSLLAAKQAIKLEKVGMRRSRRPSARTIWAQHFGMPTRSSHDAVIARIDAVLAARTPEGRIAAAAGCTREQVMLLDAEVKSAGS